MSDTRTPPDREVFSRLPANLFQPWLERERADAYRFLSEATDPVVLHRAQGRVLFVERMLKLLDSAQT